MMTRILFAAALLAASAASAAAQSPTSLGKFSDWSAWSYPGAKGKVCYIHATPSALQPEDLNHGDVSFFIRISPAENIQQEANFVVGYPFKEESRVTVDIDGQTFTMFTQGDSAWLLDAGEEEKLLSAMRAGKRMKVTGTSRRGNETNYTISLSGVTDASKKIQAECQ
jgi:invasion protein IalB